MTYIVRFGHSRTEDKVEEFSTGAEAGLAMDAWVLKPDHWAFAHNDGTGRIVFPKEEAK